jgi:hypothetical protein
MSSPSTPSPFTINVPDAVLRDLADRLPRTRFPERTAAPWRAGTDPDYLRELVTYWQDDFDWRARERELNALPQFTVGIDGQRVHFVHVRAAGSGPGRPALPLVLTHGWPSSFLEMLPLAALLTDPAGHDGDPDDAFDVVIPSLPGFAFSGLPLTGPVTPPVIADLWARLMSDVLGYSRFGAYGGDIGSHVTGFLGARHRDRVLGHLHPPAQPASGAGRHPAVVDHRAGLPRRPASRTRQRRRLRRDPEHPARHPRCCADRLPVRAGRLAGGEIPGVERLRRQP